MYILKQFFVIKTSNIAETRLSAPLWQRMGAYENCF